MGKRRRKPRRPDQMKPFSQGYINTGMGPNRAVIGEYRDRTGSFGRIYQPTGLDHIIEECHIVMTEGVPPITPRVRFATPSVPDVVPRKVLVDGQLRWIGATEPRKAVADRWHQLHKTPTQQWWDSYTRVVLIDSDFTLLEYYFCGNVHRLRETDRVRGLRRYSAEYNRTSSQEMLSRYRKKLVRWEKEENIKSTFSSP